MTRSAHETTTVTITRAQRRFASFMTDVLIYTVVLNLFVEFVDDIVIDSFGISILTAVLLKVLLDLIAGIEHRVLSYFKQRSGSTVHDPRLRLGVPDPVLLEVRHPRGRRPRVR